MVPIEVKHQMETAIETIEQEKAKFRFLDSIAWIK
jgi:hypothetical protein